MEALPDGIRSAVQKQVEFYFSDSNLPRDTFLKEKIEEDPEGYVAIPLLCSFKRMSNTLKLGQGPAASHIPVELLHKVAEALRACDSLTVSDDGNKVKRKAAFTSPERLVKEVNVRSLYASPFPYNVTLDDLTAFFALHGKVNSVRMRRHLTSKDFRGSVFVEFADEETSEQVLKKSLKHAGAILNLERKNDYMQRKMHERSLAPNSIQNGGEQMDVDGAPASEDVPDGMPASEELPAAAQPSTAQAASPQPVAATVQASSPQPVAATVQAAEAQPEASDAAAAANADGPAQDGLADAPAIDFVSGTVLQFDLEPDQVADNKNLNFRSIRPAFGGKEGGVRHCQYNNGATTGHVRFETPEQATIALETADDGKLVICGCPATVKLLEGQEEEDYFKQADEHIRAAQQRGPPEPNRGARGGFRGRGGRGRGRGPRGGGRGGRGQGQKRAREGGELQGGYKLAKTD